MRCASCSFENPEGTKFCGECGRALTHRCPSCEAENPPCFKFCGECGQPLAGQPPAFPPTQRGELLAPAALVESHSTLRSTREAERRQLTVMFCDLVGSTALAEQLDPEELRKVVRSYQKVSAEVIARYEGYIAQYLGDGLLIYFGYPQAHEDDAQRAVRAGVGMVEAIQQAAGLQAHSVQVRIGIHTGPVVIGDIGVEEKREQLALGETPNLAARLQGLAEPDTVLISSATHYLITGLFQYQDLGPQTVKGVSAPVHVYRVLGESSAQSRLEVD